MPLEIETVEDAPASVPEPKLLASVIIPAYNSERHIAACLEALLGQEYPPVYYEILVVDDGSTDCTEAVVARYQNASIRLRYFKQANQGPAAARNLGARHAAGEILLFTDSDCVPEPDWLAQMLKPFDKNPGISAVKGAYKTRQTSPVALFAQLEFEERYHKLSQHAEIDFVDTYAAAIKTDVFLGIGGFDTSFPKANNEDVELSYRMARHGHRIVFNPLAIVYHHHPDTLFKYLKTKFGRAYWRMAVYRSFPEKMGSDSYTPQTLKVQIAIAFLTLAAVFCGYGRMAGLIGGGLFLLLSIPFFAGAFHCVFIERMEDALARYFQGGFFKKIRAAMASWAVVKGARVVLSGLMGGLMSVLRVVCRSVGWIWRSLPVRLLRGGFWGLFRFLCAAYLQTVRLGLRVLRLGRFCLVEGVRALGRLTVRVARLCGMCALGRLMGAVARSRPGMLVLTLPLLFLRAVVMGLGVLWGLQAQNENKGRFSQVLVLIAADGLGLTLALLAGPYAAHYLFSALATHPHEVVAAHLAQLPFFLLIALSVFGLSGLYAARQGFSQVQEFAVLTKAVVAVSVIGYAAASLAPPPPSPVMVGGVAFCALSLLYFLRSWGRALFKCLPLGMGEDNRLPALIVGTGEVAVLIYKKLVGNNRADARVIGMVSEDPAQMGTVVGECPVIGCFDDIARIITERSVKEVFVALPTLPQETVLEIIHRHSAKSGVRFHVVATLCDLISAEVDMASSASIPILQLKNESMALLQMAVKRVFDIVVSSVVVLLTLPLWVFIVIAIKLDSEGPAIFLQDRVGKNGKCFKIFKFRTMVAHTDQYAYSPSEAGDKRITNVGAILRKTSLDEFPQLLNVLRGEMSLVGPRPEMPFIVEGYSDWQRQRLKVKPGITGLWQIMGRKDLPLHENIEYDFYYIKNQSLLLDLSILIKTVPVILRRDGAY